MKMKATITTSAMESTTTLTKLAEPCYLCPRACGARRAEGARGYCGAGAFPVVARAALHFWEEPPISGETGSGTIFFTHCSLKCCYCQNAQLAQGLAGREVSVGELAELCVGLQAEGALNINFVTPTHYAAPISQAVVQARNAGLNVPVLWNTSGYELPEVIEGLTDTVDAYLTDFKYADAQLAQRYSHAVDYPEVALAAIGKMIECAGPVRYRTIAGQECLSGGVVVRHLLLPGALEQSKRAIDMLFTEFGNEVHYSLMNQYTPVLSGEAARQFPELCVKPSPEEYEQLLDYADARGLEDYFWQQGDACQESFIPQWDFA